MIRAVGEPSMAPAGRSHVPRVTDMSFEEQVRAVLQDLRPMLRADGGDVVLVSADEASGRVEVHLTGACRSCAASLLTLSQGIEAQLLRRIPTVRCVVGV